MSIDENIAKRTTGKQTAGKYWYFLSIGIVGGASVIALALLPQQIAGLSLILVLVLFSLIDLLARRVSVSTFSTPLRRGRTSVVFIVALAAVLIAAYVLDWAIVRRGDAGWLAWTMAGLVFLVLSSGIWIIDGSSADTVSVSAELPSNPAKTRYKR